MPYNGSGSSDGLGDQISLFKYRVAETGKCPGWVFNKFFDGFFDEFPFAHSAKVPQGEGAVTFRGPVVAVE